MACAFGPVERWMFFGCLFTPPLQVAVLGGNGELGSYLCPKLVALGHDVVAVNNDDLPPYTKSAPEWHKVLPTLSPPLL
jgi:uncharacterized protein YbjT (DUF2867 family)